MLSLRTHLVAISGQGDKVIKWFNRVESGKATLERLANSGSRFENLDLKLASELLAKGHGELGRRFIDHAETCGKTGSSARGRQLLLILADHMRGTQRVGCVYDMTHIMSCKYGGGS